MLAPPTPRDPWELRTVAWELLVQSIDDLALPTRVKVLLEFVNQHDSRKTSSFPACFTQLRQPSQLDTGHAASLCTAHSLTDLLLFSHLEMGLQLLVELTILVAQAQEAAQAREHGMKVRAHRSAPLRRLQDAADDAGNSFPVLGLDLELSAAGLRQ